MAPKRARPTQSYDATESSRTIMKIITHTRNQRLG